MLIKPGLSTATYPVRIVRIDLVPVLQVGHHARSELELRGEGLKLCWSTLILPIVVSIFTGSSTTLITEGNNFKGFAGRAGAGRILMLILEILLAPLK